MLQNWDIKRIRQSHNWDIDDNHPHIFSIRIGTLLVTIPGYRFNPVKTLI